MVFLHILYTVNHCLSIEEGAILLKYPLFLLSLLFFCGCAKEHPEIPAERNELVLRFLDSLRRRDVKSAIEQGEKIYILDRQNFFMRKLIEIQQANIYLAEAQKALNRNDAEKALQILDRGLKKYPSNRELTRHADVVRKIRHAGVYFAAMCNAPNPAAMNSALIAARTGLSGIESKRLDKLFADYEKKIKKLQQGTGAAANAVKEPDIVIRSFDDK